MARNEEKQLARLNRYYLEKQKQEELKKRPPRPRLDTVNTPRDLRKWLPTITRDIEFYVKQMEVTCYTDRKIEEFQDRIQRLKQEYRAYLHKLRALEPDQNAATWADRPYANRKRHVHSSAAAEKGETDDGDEPSAKSPSGDGRFPNFAPLSTPVLQGMPAAALNRYNFEEPAPLVWNVNPETEDQPLHFAPASPRPAICARPSARGGKNQSLHLQSPSPLSIRLEASRRECGSLGLEGRVGSRDRVLGFGSCELLSRDREETGVERKDLDSSGTICKASHISKRSSTQHAPSRAAASSDCADTGSAGCGSNGNTSTPSAASNPLNLGYSDSSEDEGV